MRLPIGTFVPYRVRCVTLSAFVGSKSSLHLFDVLEKFFLALFAETGAKAAHTRP